jgi:hypothetical protein
VQFDDAEMRPFLVALVQRLEQGETIYQNRSLGRTPDELLRELQMEALDLAGWGAILWRRIEALRVQAAGCADLVVVESPYAGAVEENLVYLHRCIEDCVGRGESPYASHLMLASVLDDDVPADRERGMASGHAWRVPGVVGKTVVYCDRGISNGMQEGINDSERKGIPVVYRKLFDSEPGCMPDDMPSRREPTNWGLANDGRG